MIIMSDSVFTCWSLELDFAIVVLFPPISMCAELHWRIIGLLLILSALIMHCISFISLFLGLIVNLG